MFYVDSMRDVEPMRDAAADNAADKRDNVNHPSHYAGNGIECIDAMIAAYGEEATMHFCKLNAFKYLWRADKKNGLEDIRKCMWYIRKLLELMERSKMDD